MLCSLVQKNCYDWFLAIFPLLIAFAVFLISCRQYTVNKHKFRLELYNRRFEVYEKTLAYHQSYYFPVEDARSITNEFICAYREAIFLFGENSEVFKKLTELKDTLSFLVQSKDASNASNEETRKALYKAKQATKDPSFLMKELEKELLPWLSFSKIK